MESSKLLPFVVTAFFAVMVSIFTFSLIDSNTSEPETGKNPVNEQKSENTKDGSEKDSNITNNVENNVNGGKADINNSIDNNLKGGSDNKIDNDVSNNIEVNVDVNVTNDINNNSEGQEAGTDSNKGDNGKTTGDDKSSNEDGEKDDDKVVWGVDSASLTSNDMLSCVRDHFGTPGIWGRYLGEKEDVSAGLTADEIELLHSNDIKILVIWNHFSDATGYENGQDEARQAIQKAKELGIPEGVALFADIEPDYPVDSAFIKGWFEIINQSEYHSGIYGIFDTDRQLYLAFEQAAQNNAEILENTYIWSASPNIGITSESNAPKYQPEAPKNALVGGWQYGIDAQSCNIDTNLFHSNMFDVLW